MLVFFNGVGLVLVVIGFCLAVVLQNANIAVQSDGTYFLEVVAASVLILDIIYRLTIGKKQSAKISNGTELKQDIGNHWFLGPKFGGSLMFLPAWSTAVIAYVWMSYLVLA